MCSGEAAPVVISRKGREGRRRVLFALRADLGSDIVLWRYGCLDSCEIQGRFGVVSLSSDNRN